MDFKYLIDKVCAADYGPGFVILVCLTILGTVGGICKTVYEINERNIEFEKWRIGHASETASRQRDTTHFVPTR